MTDYYQKLKGYLHNLFLKYIQQVKFYLGADNFTQAVNGFAWKDLIQK